MSQRDGESRILVYSVCLYHHDKIRSLPKFSGPKGNRKNIDFVLLTDIKFQCDIGWDIIKIPFGGTKTRDEYRIRFDKVLKLNKLKDREYDYIIYVDNGMIFQEKMLERIRDYIEPDISLQFMYTEWRLEPFMTYEAERTEHEGAARDILSDLKYLTTRRGLDNLDLVPDTSFIIRKNDKDAIKFSKQWMCNYTSLNNTLSQLSFMLTNLDNIHYRLLDFKQIKRTLLWGWSDTRNIKILSDKWYRSYPRVIENTRSVRTRTPISFPGGYENTHPGKKKHDYTEDRILVVQGHLHTYGDDDTGAQVGQGYQSPQWFHMVCMDSVKEWCEKLQYDYHRFDFKFEDIHGDNKKSPWLIKYDIYTQELYKGYDYIIWIDSDVYATNDLTWTPLEFYREFTTPLVRYKYDAIKQQIKRHYDSISDFCGANYISDDMPTYMLDTAVMIIPVTDIELLKPPTLQDKILRGRWRDRVYLTMRAEALGIKANHMTLKFCCDNLQYTKHFLYSMSEGCQFVHFGGTRKAKDMKLSCADLYLQWKDCRKRNINTDIYEHQMAFYRH